MDGRTHAARRRGIGAHMSKVINFFPTPVIIDRLPEFEALNAALENTIRARREEDEGVALSNRGGWQSKHNFETWGGEAGKAVIAHASALATAHVESVRKSGWSIDSWANISGPGHSNALHVHGGSFWSCVYYVRAGAEGGKLVLHDPRMPALRMHAPGLRFKNAGPDVRAELQPENGMMVLFPAWLGHSVEAWQGEGDRISVAMNIRSQPWAPKGKANLIAGKTK